MKSSLEEWESRHLSGAGLTLGTTKGGSSRGLKAAVASKLF